MKSLLLLSLILIGITILIYLPYLLRINLYGLDFSSGISTIYKNFDGLEYIVIAKSFYNPSLIAKIPQNLPAAYFASHFPLYPTFIFILSPLLGFLKSMVAVTFIFTILSVWIFYLFVKNFHLSSQPFWLSTVFMILPARWLIVHSIGSPEPVFIFFIICSFYSFLKFEVSKAYPWIWLCTLTGALAVLTRPPGILLFIAYFIFIHGRLVLQIKHYNFIHSIKSHLKYFPLLLMPIGLLGIFYLYSQTYGDFLAYFHSGDNIHLMFPPYQVFNKAQFWVGDIWLEDIVYIFLLGFFAATYLLKEKLYPMAIFLFTYLGASILVAHRDISRYTLPIIPFAIIAFEKVLISKEFKIALCIVSLGIYLYAQNFLLNNTAPVPNLSLFN